MPHRAFTCRGCESTEHDVLLEMGEMPLANAFVANEADTEDEFTESLTLMMCRSCSLIQIAEEVPRTRPFSSYLWVTSTSEAALAHSQWLSERLHKRFGRAGRTPFLVEIASNDGTFLEQFRRVGFDVLGVEPSNLAEEADARGLPTQRDFFGADVAARILGERGSADVIVARNVLGHSSQLRDLVAGFRDLLAPDGRLVLEVPYAFMLRAETQYDTVFHEHLSFLTVGSVANLMASFGMKITDITFVDMNGGSLLCEIAHEGSPVPRGDQASLDFETLIDLNRAEGWRRFAQAVRMQKEAFVSLLQDLATRGKTVVGYGAAAKCMTMLNYCGTGRDLIAAIGDTSPRKQGLLCPGVRIPVVSPDELLAMKPDYIMVGAWNFKREIMHFLREEKGYTNLFIIPLPTPVIED